MLSVKLEYLWLDGYEPTANIRSKTKVLQMDSFSGELNKVPEWSFDGSSTQQAEGHSSDCILKPVRIYPDSGRKNAYLVLCEVFNADGSASKSNNRAAIDDSKADDFWFGFEQEYVLMQNCLPVGFPKKGYPAPQGPYYCAVGAGNVTGRDLVEEHLDMCLDAGIILTGINAEVMIGQWEYQCFAQGGKKAADDLIVSRYLLSRTAEKYGFKISLDPKPVKGDWNGSGMHTNFSNTAIRMQGGEEFIKNLLEKFRPVHAEHIAEYGAKNHERLTGLHETQSITQFSYGVSDRGASLRIPIATVQNGWKGYIEDRRPAANADPYRVVNRIVKTVTG